MKTEKSQGQLEKNSISAENKKLEFHFFSIKYQLEINNYVKIYF